MTVLLTDFQWRIAPTGDRCLIVEFGQRADTAVNRIVHAFARRLDDLSIKGIVDVAPAFTTVSIHYRPECFGYEALRERMNDLLAQGIPQHPGLERQVEIPVCYGGACGPDLDEVATACGCTSAQVMERHIASPHRVAMLGFVPGFPYITGLDPSLSVPRRATPRTRVPTGTVAIAGSQTGIYPFETPGGWNLIGRTPLPMFDLGRASPCLLQPGDLPRFVSITLEEYLGAQGTT